MPGDNLLNFINFSEANQEKIVEAGGLTSLLTILRNSDEENIQRVAAGALANLAMNGNIRVYHYDLKYSFGAFCGPQDLTFQ